MDRDPTSKNSSDDWVFIRDTLLALPIEVDEKSHHRAWEYLLPLAAQTGLSEYDAAYLELALRHNLPLATLDATLKLHAKKLDVEVIGEG